MGGVVMRSRRFPFWRFIGLAAAAAMLAVGLWKVVSPSAPTGPTGPTGGQGGVGLTSFPPGDQPRMPALHGRDLDGRPLDLPRGSEVVTVINVWGSWCAPCRAEAPDLVKVYRDSRARGVRFYGIDTRDDVAAARAFVRRFRISYPSFDDREGRVLGAFTGIIPVSAVPSTLVVDHQRRIVSRVVGRVDGTTLRGLIDDALTPSTSPKSGVEPSMFTTDDGDVSGRCTPWVAVEAAGRFGWPVSGYRLAERHVTRRPARGVLPAEERSS